MTPRTAVVALAGVALLAGCGSSSNPTTTPTGTAPASTTTGPARAPSPKGKLTAGEYTTLLSLAKFGKRLDKIKDSKKVLRQLPALCAKLNDAPATDLMLAQRRGCRRVTRLFAALVAFVTEQASCKQAASAGDVSCFAELFSRVARATSSATAGAREVNVLLRRRRISGACAKGIGASTDEELKTDMALGRNARIASQALYAHDVQRYTAAANQFVASLKTSFNGSSESDLAHLRKCRHD